MAKYHTQNHNSYTVIQKIIQSFCGKEKFVMESDDIHQVLSKLAIVSKREYCTSICTMWLWTHSLVGQTSLSSGSWTMSWLICIG